MTSLLITGATGFVGIKLLKLLETSDFKICVLSRQQHPDYETIVCDLGQKQIPTSAIVSVDTVFHLAGFAHDLRDASKVEHLYRAINVSATVQLAELAAQQGVQRFVFISSVKAGGGVIVGRATVLLPGGPSLPPPVALVPGDIAFPSSLASFSAPAKNPLLPSA